jgi:hypothetical protein
MAREKLPAWLAVLARCFAATVWELIPDNESERLALQRLFPASLSFSTAARFAAASCRARPAVRHRRAIFQRAR